MLFSSHNCVIACIMSIILKKCINKKYHMSIGTTFSYLLKDFQSIVRKILLHICNRIPMLVTMVIYKCIVDNRAIVCALVSYLHSASKLLTIVAKMVICKNSKFCC